MRIKSCDNLTLAGCHVVPCACCAPKGNASNAFWMQIFGDFFFVAVCVDKKQKRCCKVLLMRGGRGHWRRLVAPRLGWIWDAGHVLDSPSLIYDLALIKFRPSSPGAVPTQRCGGVCCYHLDGHLRPSSSSFCFFRPPLK